MADKEKAEKAAVAATDVAAPTEAKARLQLTKYSLGRISGNRSHWIRCASSRNHRPHLT
ncbi:MAG: hypothetical protein RIS80_1178 [Actinomycetota bacterium]